MEKKILTMFFFGSKVSLGKQTLPRQIYLST